MHVEVERERCVASGQCVILAPALFDQDDDGFAMVVLENVDENDESLALEAARICPATAITVSR